LGSRPHPDRGPAPGPDPARGLHPGRGGRVLHAARPRPEEVFAFLGRPKPVGGEYTVPRAWLDGTP
jgi:hypothetical protein